jgi:hypothetical protein
MTMLRPCRRRVHPGAALLLAIALVSCAKKGPPTGGPPDIEPPRLIASTPDSGKAGVAREASLALTFSEGMDPRSTADAISIAPRTEIRQRRWKDRTVTVVLADTLRANRTYALFLGSGARDRHGNPLVGGATVVFSTADSMPAGALEGELVARGFTATGTYLWCYDAASGRVPDSTASDFDAIGLADRDGRFRVVGLPVPGRYRLWVFADLNANRSFEPASDILVPVDTVFALSPKAPIARGLSVTVLNPRSPGRVRGTVLDSLGIEQGALTVMAVAADDSLRHIATTVDAQRHYEMPLAAGVWRMRAWRDLDRNHTWQRETEPASAERRVEVMPASEIVDVDLVLVRIPGGP